MKNLTISFLIAITCFIFTYTLTVGQPTEVEPFESPLSTYTELVAENREISQYAVFLDNHFWSDLELEERWYLSKLVINYANELGVPANLAFGVLRVENPWLDNSLVSYAGAVGLFQIIPRYWADEFDACESYKTVPGNVCVGMHVLDHYLSTTNTTTAALLRYNGCTREACANYSSLVYSYIDEGEFSVEE